MDLLFFCAAAKDQRALWGLDESQTPVLGRDPASDQISSPAVGPKLSPRPSCPQRHPEVAGGTTEGPLCSCHLRSLLPHTFSKSVILVVRRGPRALEGWGGEKRTNEMVESMEGKLACPWLSLLAPRLLFRQEKPPHRSWKCPGPRAQGCLMPPPPAVDPLLRGAHGGQDGRTHTGPAAPTHTCHSLEQQSNKPRTTRTLRCSANPGRTPKPQRWGQAHLPRQQLQATD